MESTYLILRKNRTVQMQQVLARLKILLHREFQGKERVTLLLMISALERLSEESSLHPASASLNDEDSGEIDRFVEQKLQQLEDHLFV